jgi:acetolactate synthase-1/2/3 large subunit
MALTSGARYLAETLERYGVSHVFMVPAVLRRTMAELERRTAIKPIHTHGEKSAAYMADGYARASGRPGVCMAQQVGALNLAAGVRDAWLARSPVIAMTGGSAPLHRFRGLYQAAEDLPAFEPYTKWNVAIEHVERFPDMVAQAFRAATTGNPGPVHLQFQGQEGEIDRHQGELRPLFDAAHAQIPPYRPPPAPGLAERAVERIARAERPVIIAGGGVNHSGAGTAVTELAEALQVPVATSLNGRGAIPETHPLAVGVVGTYSRRTANQAVHEADLAVLVGTGAGSMTTHFWRLPPPGTPVIQIDIDAGIIGRNYATEIAINADAREALRAMLEAASARGAGPTAAWVEHNRERQAEWKQERSALTRSAARPVRPERICHELTEWLPDDAIVLADTGHAGMWMASMFELRSPSQRFIRSAGAPAARAPTVRW